MSDIVDTLENIRQACKRPDGSDIPLGEYLLEAKTTITALRAEVEKLRAALNPFADESLWSGPDHEFVTVKRSDCDRARAALEGK